MYKLFQQWLGYGFQKYGQPKHQHSGIRQTKSAISTQFQNHVYGHCDLIDTFKITKSARNAVLEVKSYTDLCFLFSIAAGL